VTSLVAPRRDTQTYVLRGRECYADTGRPVDERLGSHILLWIVEQPEAWARAIEFEGEAELDRWPKRQRGMAELRRDQAYQAAAQIRVEGVRRRWQSHFHDGAQAEAYAAGLRRDHPNPGVRYEVVPITVAGACRSCHQPTIRADGDWRHHAGRFPAECSIEPERDPELERGAGEFEIDAGTGSMTCGYCEHAESWAEAALGYARLTGFHMLGVHRPTNTLVVLAEASTLSGQTVHLAHHCLNIPEDQHREHAPHTMLARAREAV